MPQSVAGFSISLDGFDTLINGPHPAARIEAMLLERLENPVRLLRWAVVRVEAGGHFHCEGAYLKNDQGL